jgi:hypothetical protein
MAFVEGERTRFANIDYKWAVNTLISPSLSLGTTCTKCGDFVALPHRTICTENGDFMVHSSNRNLVIFINCQY